MDARLRLSSHRRGDPQLSAQLRAEMRELASAAVRNATSVQPSVGTEMLALGFVRSVLDGLEFGDWTIVLRWVDETAERHAGADALPTLLTSFADETCRRLGSVTSGRKDELSVLRAEIERIATRPRLVRDPARMEALDEVDVALDDLITRLDRFDALTAEHSRAVSVWCARIARKLALSKAEVTHVSRGGLIHDIGKSRTPADILNAPRRLDEAEMEIMRRHAEEGEEIVLASPMIAPLAAIVRSHHERFDGRGYPDGMRGAEIPSTARIVAVADSFNAMIGRRPYRAPLSPAIALEQLEAGRGTQFDPIVVDAMIDVVTRPR